MDRRTLLRGAAALPVASAVGVSPAAAGGKRVVVLGAGLAGLTAAYNLMRHGYDVVVLEAQNRPGGRVRTVRDGFQRGGHAELGAIRIFETHEYTLKYVKEFDLALTPYDSGERAYFMQGERFRQPAQGTPWPLAGFAPGEELDPGGQILRLLGSGIAQLGDVFDPDWPRSVPSALALDRHTIDSFAQAGGASETLRQVFYAQEGRCGNWNAAAVLAMEAIGFGTTPQSIKGGNDKLPYAFAKALGGRIKYTSQVVRISQDERSVTVGYVDRTGRHEIRADRCVCALPFAPLRRVSTDFTGAKADVIRQLRYFPVARCYFQTRSRFWERESLGGITLVSTDTMAGRIWNTSSQQADPEFGMIQSYMFETDALTYAGYGHRRVARMRGLMDTLLPGIRGQIVGCVEKVWQEDPWAGGGWGWAGPGELAWMLPAMRQAAGRVHFAGEHTSLWIAWMNGAIESGERVTREILAA
ncbi:flavin monoamine oxidase family protein [Kibdelosporangium persicum]|nr:NAD(P)/FAD-dependent oxidoreductase [Kibdelosporangium persicum]